MAHIDYYFSTLSPYVYLAGTKLEDIAAKHGASINYKPLDLPTLFTRTGGALPKDRHPNRIEHRAQALPREAKKLGMPLNLKPAHWPFNAAPSCYAIIAAQAAGGGDMGKLVHAMCRGVWVEEKDLSDDAVIKACLENAGFAADVADKGLMTAADTYARKLEDGVNAGAYGSPFYVTDQDQRVWGQDKLDDLDLILAGDL